MMRSRDLDHMYSGGTYSLLTVEHRYVDMKQPVDDVQYRSE